MIEFALLGALAVRGPSGAVPLGPPKQRQVLVRLVLGRNQVVTTSDLVDDLWPDRPPSSATANLRMYVANLRRSFSAAVPGTRKPLVDVARVPSGYRLAVSDTAVDIDRFDVGAARARGALSGDKLNAALILDHLGDAARAAGDDDIARQAWTQAVEIFDRLDRRHGEAVHAKLAATG